MLRHIQMHENKAFCDTFYGILEEAAVFFISWLMATNRLAINFFYLKSFFAAICLRHSLDLLLKSINLMSINLCVDMPKILQRLLL